MMSGKMLTFYLIIPRPRYMYEKVKFFVLQNTRVGFGWMALVTPAKRARLQSTNTPNGVWRVEQLKREETARSRKVEWLFFSSLLALTGLHGADRNSPCWVRDAPCALLLTADG